MIFEAGVIALFFAFRHWQKEDAKKQLPPSKPLTLKETCIWMSVIIVLLIVLWLV